MQRSHHRQHPLATDGKLRHSEGRRLGKQPHPPLQGPP
jgi:hypothetical protein